MFYRRKTIMQYDKMIGLIYLIGIFSVVSANEAAKPSPANAAIYIDPSPVILQWSAPQNPSSPIIRYDIYFGSDADSLSPVGSVFTPGNPAWNIGTLDLYKTYFWRIDTIVDGGGIVTGPVWSFTTEYINIPGVVIDASPDPATTYLGSPSIAVLPDGTYVASHDLFGSSKTITDVFRSSDRGRTWTKISRINGQWWSTLFWHNGVLYIMGTSAEYGKCYIRKSTDGGYTWTTPTTSSNGILFNETPYHCAPVPVVIHNGRIWRAMEDAKDSGGWGDHFRSFMMSAPVDADILNASSWTSTNRLSHDKTSWLGNGWLEGNAVVDPEGKIVNILRVDYPEKAAIVRISDDGTTATFDPINDFIDFHGGATKFTIRYDSLTGRYWSLVNKQRNPTAVRNRLVLVSSKDLRNWAVEEVILEHQDSAYHAWQYVDWLFDGNDIIAVSRTAYDTGLGTQAHNYHDANFMTFHRISNFRRSRPPVFDMQPKSVSAYLGSQVFFTVIAHSDITAYQWFKSTVGGDIELFDNGRIQGTQTPQLVISDVHSPDEGKYYCKVTNGQGSAISDSANLNTPSRKMRAHWKLDEDCLVWNGSTFGGVMDSVSGTAGVLYGYTQSDLTTVNSNVLNRTGPQTGSDKAYDFAIDTGISGVNTNRFDAIPEAGDFTLLVWLKTSNLHPSQGHIFSCNNGQVGRANLYLENSGLKWFHSGGVSLAENNSPIFDNQWHQVGVVRSGSNWSLLRDGQVVAAGTSSGAVSQTVEWMIGRMRSYNGDYDGLVGDVKVYNYCILDKPDLDGDGSVNLDDFSVLSQKWLSINCGACSGVDLNCDENVDIDDLILFLQFWMN